MIILSFHNMMYIGLYHFNKITLTSKQCLSENIFHVLNNSPAMVSFKNSKQNHVLCVYINMKESAKESTKKSPKIIVC